MLARIQFAGSPRRDLGHRARRLHRPRTRNRPLGGASLLRITRKAWLPDAETAARDEEESADLKMPKKKAGKDPEVQSLLIELLTEELPPKALLPLAEAFRKALCDYLSDAGFLVGDKEPALFVTPRRLATLFPSVRAVQEDRESIQKGPYIIAGPDAIEKFAAKWGMTSGALIMQSDNKGQFVVAHRKIKGEPLDQHLAGIVTKAIKQLPVPKFMRWGSSDEEFVRPVHGLIMMHGKRIVPGEILGVKSSNRTLGHRFLSRGMITLKDAKDYEPALLKQGKVIADFSKRRSTIKDQLNQMELTLAQEIARTSTGRTPISIQPLVIDTERKQQLPRVFPGTADREAIDRAVSCSGGSVLLDDVTSLVEWPRAYWGRFDEQFLAVPVECLALTMKNHQRYFPVFNKSAELQPYFVVISNLDESSRRIQKGQISKNIVLGNERVLGPRLADAQFFYNQDCKIRLEERVPRLAHVTYHNKLGSQRDRVDWIKLFSARIARDLDANSSLTERAAELSKADLLTDMVGEFPELQGIMGRYYALHDGESETVANAIEAHYRPRFAGDKLPNGLVACAVALADKLHTLVGMFAIGEVPTGEKDPFALRRHALGVVRILIETPIRLDAFELLRAAERSFPKELIKYNPQVLRDFVRERLRSYLREREGDVLHVEAVIGQLGGLLYQAPARLEAVRKFAKLPEAQDLAIANKRVLNIIRKNEEIGYAFKPPVRSLMKDRAEIALMDAVERLAPIAEQQFNDGDFEGSMRQLAGIKEDVDRFFDEVMVMVEDVEIRNNRAALLQQLGRLMNRVADISKLVIEK